MRKNAALRVEQARALVRRFARRQPVLLLGDLNEGPGGDAVHLLGRGLLFHGARVLRGGGSDHLAVQASVVIP